MRKISPFWIYKRLTNMVSCFSYLVIFGSLFYDIKTDKLWVPPNSYNLRLVFRCHIRGGGRLVREGSKIQVTPNRADIFAGTALLLCIFWMLIFFHFCDKLVALNASNKLPLIPAVFTSFYVYANCFIYMPQCIWYT